MGAGAGSEPGADVVQSGSALDMQAAMNGTRPMMNTAIIKN